MLHSEQPPVELGQFTGFLMNYLGTRSGRRFAAALEPFELHPRHFGVMTVLDARPGITQQDPADRRKRSIHLTDEGRAQLKQMRAVARQVGEQSFAALTAEERATLHQLLRKLAGFEDEQA